MARSATARSSGFGRRAPSHSAALAAKPAAKRALGTTSHFDNPAARSVLMEFERCAVVLAVVLSVMNRSQPRKVVHFSLKEFQPPNPTCFLGLRKELVDFGFADDAIGGLDYFYECYSEALPAIVEITNDMPNGFNLGWMMTASRDFNRAANAAKSLAHLIVTGSNQVNALRPVLAVELPALLDDVCAGGAPCWTKGHPTLPEWHTSRTNVRRVLNFGAMVTLGDRESKVLVTEISRTALGMRPGPKCKAGDRLIVTFDFGRSLAGSITWTDGSACGMELDTPLALSDPLIAAG